MLLLFPVGLAFAAALMTVLGDHAGAWKVGFVVAFLIGAAMTFLGPVRDLVGWVVPVLFNLGLTAVWYLKNAMD